jgi:cytochrome c-type biogenesis protein CcmH/NrfG
MAVICLLLGLALGYLLRGSSSATPVVAAAAASTASVPDIGPTQVPGMGGMPVGVSSAELADKAVALLLESLKQNPKDVAKLVEIANTYYDAKVYNKAIQYYGDALKITPKNVDVRTDMATAYWYIGDADHAIAEMEKALSFDPTHAQTLFNLGIVKSQGKRDAKGAIAAWRKLLETNPNYPNRQSVEQLIEQARSNKG